MKQLFTGPVFKKTPYPLTSSKLIKHFASQNNKIEIYCLRHGQTFHNILEKWAGTFQSTLTRVGKEQALQAGKLLKERNIVPDIIYTSTLQRTIETANLVKTGLELSNILTKEDERINEHNVGALTNQAKTQENKQFLQNIEQKAEGYDHNCYRGESRQDVMTRMRDFLESIKEDVIKDKKILIVSHSNALKALLMNLSGQKKVDSIPNAEPFKIIFTLSHDNQLKYEGIKSISEQKQITKVDIEDFLEESSEEK
ncbi:MAG: histidine phosphatase family protein, partial [Rickettsiales bacterium]|nr:histidine phosphatase family protein [Rickettsiales bacterium]